LNDFLALDKQLCFAVYETSNVFTKLYTSALKPFDLTYPQYLVLLALWEGDGVTLKVIGEKLKLSTGTLTPMTKRMIEKGWIKKERSKLDERQIIVELTDFAQEQKAEITQQVTEAVKSCKIDLEEYQILMNQLHDLRVKLEKGRAEE